MGFPHGHNARSRSIQIEKKARGRSLVVLRTPPGTQPSPFAPSSIPLLVTPRIFKLQPFRHVKGDFCRTPSIGFNGHRYSNLFDGGASSFNPSTLSLILVFSRSFIHSLQPPRSLPTTKTVTRNRCELPGGWQRERGKKNLHLASYFFLLSSPSFRPSILARIWNGSRADRCAHLREVTARRRHRYFERRFLRRREI